MNRDRLDPPVFRVWDKLAPGWVRRSGKGVDVLMHSAHWFTEEDLQEGGYRDNPERYQIYPVLNSDQK